MKVATKVGIGLWSLTCATDSVRVRHTGEGETGIECAYGVEREELQKPKKTKNKQQQQQIKVHKRSNKTK